MSIRTIDAVRSILLQKARAKANPVIYVSPEVLKSAMAPLTSCDRDQWAASFCQVAQSFEEAANTAEAAGRPDELIEALRTAYGLYWLARYPTTNSPGKRKAYEQARRTHAKLLSLIDPKSEAVAIPFAGRSGEGNIIRAFFRRPAESEDARLPLIVTWGGIDTFKEERSLLAEPILKQGFAILAIDMPGTGESPIKGSHDAERLWTAVFDWVDNRHDIDRSRVAVYGMSTGGYWATKVAHRYTGKILAAINHGGPAHFAFARSWIESSEHGEYPLELVETLASAWGLPDREAWIDYAPSLSLLDSGLLESDSAPMLLLNGTDDTVFPIEDMYLLMRHGRPKTGRLYEGYGHMGASPKAPSTIVAWLREVVATPP